MPMDSRFVNIDSLIFASSSGFLCIGYDFLLGCYRLLHFRLDFYEFVWIFRDCS